MHERDSWQLFIFALSINRWTRYLSTYTFHLCRVGIVFLLFYSYLSSSQLIFFSCRLEQYIQTSGAISIHTYTNTYIHSFTALFGYHVKNNNWMWYCEEITFSVESDKKQLEFSWTRYWKSLKIFVCISRDCCEWRADLYSWMPFTAVL